MCKNMKKLLCNRIKTRKSLVNLGIYSSEDGTPVDSPKQLPISLFFI